MVRDRKKRGAYFTPHQLAQYLAEWAIRTSSDSVLDPGAGDGAFLLAAFDRLASLGGKTHDALVQVQGVEIDPTTSEVAAESLAEKAPGATSSVIVADIFDVGPEDGGGAGLGYDTVLPSFNAVIGNPPYVRYHSFKGEQRKKALARAKSLGVHLPALSSLWAPFLVHAISFVKEGGRLAMVLPAELLTVDYGKEVRDHLLRRFSKIQLIVFENRVFPEVLEDVVLLMAEKGAGSESLRFVRVPDASHLDSQTEPILVRSLRPKEAVGTKWTRFLLSEEIDATYQELIVRDEIGALGDIAEVDIGVVTGKNDYFILSESAALEHAIRDESLLPILASSRDLHGLRFDESDYATVKSLGRRCMLIDPQEELGETDEGLRNYLEQGVADGIARAYKCKGREPWHAVPSIYVPDAFLSYMSSSYVKFAINDAGAVSTNTIHRVRFKKELVDPIAMATSWYNSLTMLSCELNGRSYGGGVLKHETKEAESICIIRADSDTSGDLRAVSKKVDSLLRAGEAGEAIGIVDEILLEGFLGISSRGLGNLRTGVDSLLSRRFARMGRQRSLFGEAPGSRYVDNMSEEVERPS